MTTYRRRNRVLCLHGPSQSAASFRAGLKPICDRMESNWEFHFLDAPFIIPDEDDVDGSERASNVWSRAAMLASRVAAIDSDLQQGGEPSILQKCRQETWTELQSTAEGQEVWRRQEDAGVDGVELLVSTKVAKSMSRDWVVRVDRENIAGVDVGLGMIGDYMRENGNFHGVIGFDSGSCLALLLQSLLSHPRSSSTAFPTFFAKLPQGVTRMPRMGGWEEEPPAPDDARLGSENLTKDFVPAQKPFEAVIAIHPSIDGTGTRAKRWLSERQPILRTVSSDAFSSHSLAVHGKPITAPAHPNFEHRLEYPADAFVFDKQYTTFIADFLALAIGSCQGDRRAHSELANLGNRPTIGAQPAKL